MLTRLLADTFTRGRVLGEDQEEAEIILGGQRTAAGERVSEVTAMKVAAVYSCVSLLSSSVELMPLHVRQDVGDGVLRDDRASRLWELLHDRPNSEMHAGDFWGWATRCMQLLGNAYGWLERDPLGRVVAIWPLHPRRVTPRRNQITRRKYYEVTAPDDLERVEFYGSTDEILQIRGFGGNALQGESVISYQRETIGRALREDRHVSETLRNHARPGGLLKVKGKLEQDAADRLAARWQAAHSGGKVGGTAVLEEDASWESVTMTAADLELLQQRALSREDIANAFHVPPDMVITGTKQANLHYSSDESRDLRLVKYGVMPWAGRIQRALEVCDMLPWRFGMPTGRRVPRFDPDGLLLADILTRFQAYKQGIDAGWLDPNTPRRKEDLEPIEGLDKPIPVTVKPAETER